MLRDRLILASLAVSAFFHLSMITLFSIEMRYDRRPFQYYAFDIVDVSRLTQAPPTERATLSLPAADQSPFASPEAAAAAAAQLAALPQISLPVLSIDTPDAITLSQPNLVLDPRFEPRVADASPDAWARFGEEIQDLRSALRRIPLLERLESETQEAAETELELAPGVRGHIAWIGEPEERAAVLAPPIDPGWLDNNTLAAPVQILFRVAPDGRVTEVLAPVGESEGVVAGTVEALRRFRFEPVTTTGEQAGTLMLTPEEAEP